MKYKLKVHKMSWWAMLLVLPILLPALLLALAGFVLGFLATVAGFIAMPWCWFISWLDGHKGLVKKGNKDE